MLIRILNKIKRHFRRYEDEQNYYISRLKNKNNYVDKVC
ncbi:conserved hypothetical protein [Clostridium phage D-1873]|uniref:Uncharacterized protein n=1 Tax=Clostridium botulinum D str. 1873 TaxID=592027 RepID=A0A9P2LKA4_CLOBO|nr:conserved hypothetical protein [Clostridium phage D-1873]